MTRYVGSLDELRGWEQCGPLAARYRALGIPTIQVVVGVPTDGLALVRGEMLTMAPTWARDLAMAQGAADGMAQPTKVSTAWGRRIAWAAYMLDSAGADAFVRAALAALRLGGTAALDDFLTEHEGRVR